MSNHQGGGILFGRLWMLLAFIYVSGLSLIAGSEPPTESYDGTWRLPVMAIPQLEKAPQIDAVVEEGEWSRAALFPSFVVMDPAAGCGLPIRKPTWLWMGYMEDSLYIAFRQELPPEDLPLEVVVTDQRDRCEGLDNAVSVFLAPDPQKELQYHFALNAASQIYDRRFDHPSGIQWDGKVTYQSRRISTGWEGELKIPFAELGLSETPVEGTKWKCKFFSFWRKPEQMLGVWPYSKWIGKGDFGVLVFSGKGPAVRFEGGSALKVTGGEAQVQTKLFWRKQRAEQSYYQQLASAVGMTQVEGGTWDKLDKIVADALKPFEVVSEVQETGEYLLRYDVKAGARVLASGVTPLCKYPPLEVEVTPCYLMAKKLVIKASTELPQAVQLEVRLQPGGAKASGIFKSQRATVELSTDELKDGEYEMMSEVKDAKGTVIAKASTVVAKPLSPDWWTMKEGLEPRVPPPWTPVKADASRAEVWGRQYEFKTLAVPSQVETRGQKILAGPMEFRTSTPWEKSSVKLVKQDEEMAVYESESVAGGLTLKVRSQVEFDGFMYVDLDLVGEGSIGQLDFVIPFKKEHAILMQNYCKASGPGNPSLGGGGPDDPKNPYKGGKRFAGFVPADPLQTPPMLTTWIGTDRYGLEWSCESSRGWAMSSPNKAMEVVREGEKVILAVHLISKTVALSKEKPRHIRFGLVATPTKAILPHLKTLRIYDNCNPALLPYTWGEYPVWHPPLKNAALIGKNQKWIEDTRKAGTRILINGGWNVSTQTPEWNTWGKEMVAEPLLNVSFDNAKQFGACWNSPFAAFMVNSYGYNAKLLKFDGLMFDTVVPNYECQSLLHGCGWTDDEGKLWPSYSIFTQREVWKKFYRIFHGGVRPEGAIRLPMAGGPIMAVCSFTDMRLSNEGFFMNAKTLKEGYPPDMVRANMTGDAYGFRGECNLKGSPLFQNERIGALLVNGSEPYFRDYRFWSAGYASQDQPTPYVWAAWDWVDRWNADWFGWWENGEYVKLMGVDDKQVLASFWLQKGKKVLLVVTNYEAEPLGDLAVKLDLAKLGLKGKICAEDAITLEPMAVEADGTLKLDVLAQRYRLIMISNEPARYREEVLGSNLVMGAPAEIKETWQSADIPLEPNTQYVLKALVKIDRPMGEGSSKPNVAGDVSHYVSINLAGEGILGANGRHKAALCPIENSDQFLPYEETPNFKNAHILHFWEKTPGWETLLTAVQTGENTKSGKFTITLTDPGQALIKSVTLQKVK